MYRIGLTVIVLIGVACGRVEAAALDVHDLYRRAEALAQSLFRPPPADQEIIKPGGDMDPKMALAPPAGGTMRLIEPPARPRQR